MVCTLCGEEFHYINLCSGSNQKYRDMILRYGGVTITTGFLCRKCHRLIQNLDELSLKFQSLCQKSLITTNHRLIKPKALQPLPINTNQQKSSPPNKIIKSAEHNYFKSPKPPSTKKKLVQAPPTVSKVAARELTGSEFQKISSSLQTRNIDTLADTLVSCKIVRTTVLGKVAEEAGKKVGVLGKRKCVVSSLMNKRYSSMQGFSWDTMYDEHLAMFPDLLHHMMCIALGTNRENPMKVKEMKPKIGLIMAILLQSRHHDLSLVQRVISTTLYSNLCDQKVYDRLQPLGVCLSYMGMGNVIEEISGHFNQELVKLIKNHKRFRFIGDNVNWMEHVSEETMGKKTHMKHAFGSLVIAQTLTFDDVPSIQRQPFYQVPSTSFILNQCEWQEIKQEYIELISRVVCENIPYFANAHAQTLIKGPHSDRLNQQSQIIPLPLLFKNEQYYADVVDILDFYEGTLAKAFEEADMPLSGTKVHIGGDQLTRERFSGAKRLRISGEDDTEKLKHLSPISFELFHMMMNFLQFIFKMLYKDGMNGDKGSMMCEKVRINRTSVNPDIRKAYDADKDFFISYVHSHIIEATLTHFGMESVDDVPSRNKAPENPEQKPVWMKKQIGCIIDDCIAPSLPAILNVLHSEPSPDHTPPVSVTSVDQVNNYACMVLELGMLFISLQDMIHLPNRDRGLRLMKFLQLILRHHNHRSKYANEIVRFLVHQTVTLSNQEAHQMFYGLFVNTKGKITSHIAADDCMEGMVAVFKKHIHHMYSNKTEHNIQVKTRALGGVKTISDQFDVSTNTIVRARKHSVASSRDDETAMVRDLREVRPFVKISGRQFLSGTMTNRSALAGINVKDTKQWIQTKKFIYATEKGN